MFEENKYISWFSHSLILIAVAWLLALLMVCIKRRIYNVYSKIDSKQFIIQCYITQSDLFIPRCGFCYMEVENFPAGIYNVIPTTFLPKQEGPFFLDFSSVTPLRISQLQ